MVKLPGRFSPINAIKQTGSVLNPAGGVSDYDIFGTLGQTTSDIDTSFPSQQSGTTSLSVGVAKPDTLSNLKPTSGVGGGGYVMGANTPYSEAGSYGGGGGGSAVDLAAYDEQANLLRNLLGSTQTRLGQGLTQLGDDFNRETSNANEQRSRALEDYAVRREDTTRGKDQAIGQVDTNARTLANSLRQRIGMASGSGSSAYQITAPGAVARDASIERQGVQEDFGANFRDLATKEKRATSDFDSLLSDLQSQRQQKESGLREGVLGQEQSIYGQLADVARKKAAAAGGGYDAIRSAGAADTGQYQQRQSQIDGLFNQFRTPYSVKPVQVEAPTLKDYTVDRAAIGGGQGQTDTYSPYSNLLRKQLEEEKLV